MKITASTIATVVFDEDIDVRDYMDYEDAYDALDSLAGDLEIPSMPWMEDCDIEPDEEVSIDEYSANAFVEQWNKVKKTWTKEDSKRWQKMKEDNDYEEEEDSE